MSELKKAKELMKVLRCPQDCDKCNKTINGCLQDLRKSVNMLIRISLRSRIKEHELEEIKNEIPNSMVS